MVDFVMLESEAKNRGRRNRKKSFLQFLPFHCKIYDSVVQLLQFYT